MRATTAAPSAAVLAALLTEVYPVQARTTEPVRSADIVEASAFLEAYREASAAQSSEFYELYSDRAVVHTRAQNQDQGIAFQGRVFKAWGRQLLSEGRAGPDGSVFRDATVEQRGNRLLIRAKRYAITRCYWDLTYQVGIEREGPAYHIVDEHLTMDPSAHCGAVPHLGTGAQLGLEASADAASVAMDRGALPTRTAGASEWHPLSEQELAEKSLRIAQQIAAARGSQAAAGAATVTSASATPVASPVGLKDTLARAPDGTEPPGLRLTPTE